LQEKKKLKASKGQILKIRDEVGIEGTHEKGSKGLTFRSHDNRRKKINLGNDIMDYSDDDGDM